MSGHAHGTLSLSKRANAFSIKQSRQITTPAAKATPPPDGDIDADGGLKTHVIQEMMRSYDGTIRTFVTSRVAKLLLEHNTRNRKFSEKRAKAFKEIILQGRWINTREPIIVSASQSLSEGQHRLSGIVQADIGVEADICFGAAEEAFWVTGTGAHRSAADALSIIGIDRAMWVAAAARVVLWYENSSPFLWKYQGNDEIIMALGRWPDLPDAVDFLYKHIKEPKLRASYMSAFVFLALRQKNEVTVLQFLDVLRTGLAHSERSPVYQLRKRLMDDKTLVRNRPTDVERKLALTIKAWNMWQANEECLRLQWHSYIPYPVMDGVRLDQPKARS